jgi:hypothetical protein
VRAIRIDLASLQVGHERVPVVIRAVGIRIQSDDVCRARGISVIEQQQLDERRVPRKHAEVDAAGHD